MASTKDSLRALLEQKAELETELQALRNRIEGLDLAISIVQDGGPKSKRSAFSVKTYVLDLLRERGASGLNATIAVEIAAKRGDNLDRSSAASLLSRLKQEGLLNYDGALYRLKGVVAGESQLDSREPHDRARLSPREIIDAAQRTSPVRPRLMIKRVAG